MLKKLLFTMIAWAAGVPTANRFYTRDAANESSIKFRMNAGFPGDISRTHPVSVEPTKMDSDEPVLAYGVPVLIDSVTGGARRFVAGDTAVAKAYGFSVRPYPTQQSTGGMSSAFGAATPPTDQPLDVMRLGYIMGKLNVPADGAALVKGAPVFVWCAADSGAHKQGGLEAQASGGNTAALDTSLYSFNGSADAAGNVEVVVGLTR